MIKGLYAAASAMLAGLNRQNVLSHNIANLNTPGFKQTLMSMDDFIETAVVQPSEEFAYFTGLSEIGELGLGVTNSPEITDFAQGALRPTNQPFDLAIEGPGFFSVQTPNGERYTRDGRFNRDVEGQLVTIDGYQVLSDGGQPIQIPEGVVNIDKNGTITVDEENVGKIGIYAFEDPEEELVHDMPNLFEATGGASGEEVGTIQQGYLEMSNANASDLMTQMSIVARAYEAAQQMVQNQDELLAKTIATLGRF